MTDDIKYLEKELAQLQGDRKKKESIKHLKNEIKKEKNKDKNKILKSIFNIGLLGLKAFGKLIKLLRERAGKDIGKSKKPKKREEKELKW